jgi:hypothetical protein
MVGDYVLSRSPSRMPLTHALVGSLERTDASGIAIPTGDV